MARKWKRADYIRDLAAALGQQCRVRADEDDEMPEAKFVLEPQGGDIHVLHNGSTLGGIYGDGTFLTCALYVDMSDSGEPEDQVRDSAQQTADQVFKAWWHRGYETVDSGEWDKRAGIYHLLASRKIDGITAMADEIRWAAAQTSEVSVNPAVEG